MEIVVDVCWCAPYNSVNHHALMAFAVVVLVHALLAADFQCTKREVILFQSCGFLLLVPCPGSYYSITYSHTISRNILLWC